MGRSLTSLAVALCALLGRAEAVEYEAKSGIRPWVDPATPKDKHTYISSRGEKWELVMSDEFNTPGRSFKPGQDHMWTSIEKPDGVNAALGIYSHNMTRTKCSGDMCYLEIKIKDEVTVLRLWNNFRHPPGFQKFSFFYRSGMMQTWNKFCYQGGMMEVKAQLPGAVSPESGNPDATETDLSKRIKNKEYYPAWPGIWMLGNLGRAIFSASTNRMWPFSYNECDNDVFISTNQRISACDPNPGHGLNPRQGRGAPEIDILEGAASKISSSIQVAPGMPMEYRMFVATDDPTTDCRFDGSCKTPGANMPDVPTAYYMSKRGHKSWYQGLRYAANNFCKADPAEKQDYATIKKSLEKGITDNSCKVDTCPGSKDPNADIGLMPGSSNHWSINENGTCFPIMNGYTGTFLCSPGNRYELCPVTDIPKPENIQDFAYQMDAISADWPVHIAAYKSFLTYQVEWVTGDDGYALWLLDGQPLFEIPAESVINVPQNSAKSNPKKIMVEEPLYLILNIAISSSWGASPPNAGKPCRGDGSDPKVNRICDSFPMYMKVDHVRLYQDVSEGSKMAVGCDPKTHPTKQWIIDHIDEYQDYNNPVVEVAGKAFCQDDDDCTIKHATSKIVTGQCVKGRCKCLGTSWTGPRCTTTISALKRGEGTSLEDSFDGSYGPPFSVSLAVAGVVVILSTLSVLYSFRSVKKSEQERKKQAVMQPKSALSISSASEVNWRGPKDNYSTNFI